MVIDLSSYNGQIDFEELRKEPIERVILRSTTKNGKLDVRFMENLNGFLTKTGATIDAYKFAYARKTIPAFLEAAKTFQKLREAGALGFIQTFWLDLEDFDGRAHTSEEVNEVIFGYYKAAHEYHVELGLYFNYNYAMHIVDPFWNNLMPLWIARYNKTLGDTGEWKPVLWQYTSKGVVNGITGNVDISKELKP